MCLPQNVLDLIRFGEPLRAAREREKKKSNGSFYIDAKKKKLFSSV